MPLPANLYQQALDFFKKDQISEAVPLLEQALRADPSFSDAYEALGLFYFKLNRLDEAIALMKKQLEVYPENLMAYTNLSRFYAAKGLLDEAEAAQAEGRRLSWKQELEEKRARGENVPTDEEMAAKARQDLQKRLETYRQVIALDPLDVLGYFSLGTASLDGKMYGQAREAFEKAVEVNPAHSPSYLGLGQAYEALGRKRDAVLIYKEGIPHAERAGDMVPLRKMQTRIIKLEAENS